MVIGLSPDGPVPRLTSSDIKDKGVVVCYGELFAYDKPPWQQFAICRQRSDTLDWGVYYRLVLPVFDVLMPDLGWALLLVATPRASALYLGPPVPAIAQRNARAPIIAHP